MGHVALYCRISRKTKDGLIESVEAQERWGRDYAAMAWPGQPIVVYCDNAVTAADEDVWRPGFEKLREAVRHGEVSHIWCVAQDRLHRVEAGWFALAAELVAAGIEEVHTRNDGLLRVADDISGIKAVLAAGEIRKLKMRINNRLDDNASQGVAPGSRPFGYVHGVKTENGRPRKTYVVVPEQAEAIRWAADRVLSGWSLASVAAELGRRGLSGPHRVKVRDEGGNVIVDEQGEPVTRGSVLTASSVRSMITNPTVAGYRVHRGQVVGRGNWAPILDEATWQACRARLSAPRTVARSDGGQYPITASHSGYSGRKYVLTGGLARCGVCDAPLVGHLKQMRNGQRVKAVKAYLSCHPNAGGKACVGIMLEATEQYVVDRLFAELDRPEFLGAIAVDEHAERRGEIVNALGGIEGKRAEMAAMWGTPGGLTTAEWQAARAALAETERALRTELAAKPPPPRVVDIDRVRASWPLLDLGEQREILRLFIGRVVIGKAIPGRKGFDAARVEIVWKRALDTCKD